MVKVCLIGAAGGIGQPLALLLKLNPNVHTLALYDVVNTPGVGADLAHIDSNVISKAYIGKEDLGPALRDADFVLVPAGVPRKPGMTRGDLFNINADICAELAAAVAQHAPQAIVMVISNPVNSTTVVFRDILAKHGAYSPRRLMGITNLDHVRANAFLAQHFDSKPKSLDVTVVGGHSGHSIVPLFGKYGLPEDALEALVNRVQYGGDEVVIAKQGKGSSTLSMAYAAHDFFDVALLGFLGIAETARSAYIPLGDGASNVSGIAGAQHLKDELGQVLSGPVPNYFAAPVTFNKHGIKAVKSEWVKDLTAGEIDALNLACGFITDAVVKGHSVSS